MAAKDGNVEGGKDPVEGKQPAPEPKTPEGSITLTSAQLATRLQRKEESVLSSVLKDLGVEDVEALKTSLTALKGHEDAKLTADERVKAELTAALTSVASYKETADAATSQALAMQVEITTLKVMSSLEKPFVDPVAAMQLTDMSGVVKDGKIDAEALGEALKVTAEKFPWALAQTSKVTPSPSKANPTDPDVTLRTDEQRRAQYFGGAGTKGGFFEGGGVVGGVVTPE